MILLALSTLLLFFLFVFFAFCFAAGRPHQFVLVYFSMAAAFLVGVLAYFVLGKILRIASDRMHSGEAQQHKVYRITAVAVSICIGGLFVLLEGARIYAFDTVYPQSPLLVIMGVAFCAVLAVSISGSAAADKLPRILTYAAIVFSIVVYAHYAFVPNILNSEFFVVHHVSAVTQSFYNVSYNIPFTMESSGIYGHYALLFLPFTRIFGTNPVTIAWAMVFLAVLTHASASYIICRLTKRTWLRVLCILALPAFLHQSQVYLQYYPLRQAFTCLVLAHLIAILSGARRLSWKSILVGYIFCALAIIAVTDAGLVATVGYTAGIWIAFWRKKKIFCREMIKVYCLTALCAVCSLAVMVLLVNLYNALCGGPFVLRDCFFPIVGGGDYTDGLQTSLISGKNMITGESSATALLFFGLFWLLPILLFLANLFLGLSSTTIFSLTSSRCYSMMAAIGAMGLLQSFYMLNRTVAGGKCVYIYAILGLCCLIELSIDDVASVPNILENLIRAARRGVSTACVVILAAFLFLTCATSMRSVELLAEKRYSTGDIRAVCAQLEAEIPQDTYAFGYYTQEIYSILGWDPGYHYRDPSDMFGEGIDIAVAEINAQESILICSANVDVLEDIDAWDCVQEIPAGTYSLLYYVKK